MKKADMASGCIGVAFSLAVCSGALAMPMGTVGNPGAGFLPFWVGVALATMSLALIAGSLLYGDRSAAPSAEARRPQRVAWTLGGLLFYALSLDSLGYLVTTFLLLSAVLRVLGQRRWHTILGFAALATGGSYALFGLWLGVPLPRGSTLP